MKESGKKKKKEKKMSLTGEYKMQKSHKINS